MAISDKIAYIKGLVEGLKLDEDKDEVKVINAIIDVLDEMADTIDDQDEYLDFLDAKVDEIDEDLGEVEEIVYDEDDLDDCDLCSQDCDSCFGCCQSDYFDDNELYLLTCDECGEEFEVSEDELFEGEVVCPVCKHVIKLDLSDFHGCECDCDDCNHDN